MNSGAGIGKDNIETAGRLGCGGDRGGRRLIVTDPRDDPMRIYRVLELD